MQLACHFSGTIHTHKKNSFPAKIAQISNVIVEMESSNWHDR